MLISYHWTGDGFRPGLLILVFSFIKPPVRKIYYLYFIAQKVILHKICLFYCEKFLFLKAGYTVCCYSFDTDEVMYKQKMLADYKLILKYVEQLRKRFAPDTEFICGYEAGCLGYSLYHQLMDHGMKCVILAPTTMAITNTSRVKTDKRDAGNIARCLAFHTYSEVHVPTDEDNS